MDPLPSLPGGDVDRAPTLLAIQFVPFPVGALLLAARCFVRWKLKNYGPDDFFMIMSFIFWIAALIVVTIYAQRGGCRHVFYLEPMQVVNVLRQSFIAQALGIVTPVLGKTSIAFLILRIMGPQTFWRKYMLYLMMVLYIILSILVLVFTFAQCSPVEANWTPRLPGSKCWDRKIFVNTALAQSSLGSFVDLALALLPVSIIWGLSLQPAKKLALSILLSLGVFAGICAAVKTKHLHSFAEELDITWATFDIFAWASAEAALVIICGCIPPIKPLYDRIATGKCMLEAAGYPKSKSSYVLHSGSVQAGKKRPFDSSHSANVTARRRSETDDTKGFLNANSINVERGYEIENQYNSEYSVPSRT